MNNQQDFFIYDYKNYILKNVNCNIHPGEKVVVVGGDKMSSIINYADRTTCVIFGDGAGAVMMEPNEEGLGIVDSIMCSDGAGRVHLHQKAGGSAKPSSKNSSGMMNELFPISVGSTMLSLIT